MQFVLDYLKKKPKAAYAEVKEAAAKKRLKIFPIMYGRAQTLLGHIPMSPRGKGKAARKKKAAARKTAARKTGRRGPGRPRKAPSPALDSLEAIVSAMKQSEAERERYKRALQQIEQILDNVG